jgi:hypothetical protein
VVVVVGVLMRALRWNLITGVPLRKYGHFWRSASIGNLANLIFPGRAGEVLRIVTLSRFAQVLAGQAVTSAIVDRVADELMLAVFMALVFAMHGAGLLGSRVVIIFLVVFGIAAAGIGAFVIWGERWKVRVNCLAGRLPAQIGQRVTRWYAQALEGVQTLHRPSLLLTVGGITLVAFLLDYAVMWLIMAAFGWSLPFGAAITVGVVAAAGMSLPSAPGGVGIYQAACVFALGLYGIGVEQAVAFSVILHVLGWVVNGAQGGWSALSYGFSLSALGANLSLPPRSVGRFQG